MSYTKLLYHIVYATKERRPFLAPSWRADMHDYLGGTVRGLKGNAVEIGGVENHVHLLTSGRSSSRTDLRGRITVAAQKAQYSV